MTNKEMSNFTHRELSAFTHLELSLKTLEEISFSKNLNYHPIPPEIISSIPEVVSTKFNIKTVIDFLTAMRCLSELVKSITGKSDLFSACADLTERLISYLNNLPS